MSIKIPDYLSLGEPEEQNQLQRSPAQLLGDAAEQLTQRMQGVIQATVFTINPGGGSLFRHTFYLLVPVADDYTDPLFYAWHNDNFYPAYLLRSGEKQGKDEKKCKSAKDFEQELQSIFDSPETKQRIYALADLAESRKRQNTQNHDYFDNDGG